MALSLFLLGPPRVERDGEGVQVDTRKAMALLAYLAVTNQAHTRDRLAALFWPDSDAARAYASLRQALWLLNRALGGHWLEVDPETVRLECSAGAWLDVDAFHDLLAQAKAHGHAPGEDCPASLALLEQAAALYRDDFLAGFSLPDSPEFDEWQFFQAESLRRDLLGALERLARGAPETAIAHARRWAALDPLSEPAHRRLMQLYASAGQRGAALRQYQEVTRLLRDELGVAPEAETTALYHHIQAGERRDGQARPTPQPASAGAPPLYPLPAQPTPFVGRQDELAEIAGRLRDPESRLVTLVGPGGVGKTRLALQAATSLAADFPDGVCFVPLAGLDSPGQLTSTLLEAVQPGGDERAASPPAPRQGRHAGAGQPAASRPSRSGGERLTARLVGYLRERRLLLVLDNLEHLLAGMGPLAEILAHASQVKILATSRERLGLRGEWVLEIHGLPFPAAVGNEAAFEAYPAVALFLQTARRVRPGFELGPADRPCVLNICRLVEGLPLGLELAASWARLLSCAEIGAEIERGLDFLAAPSRDAPERHRSLRAVFDHSWRLLDEAERRAFRELSVFRGGFRREAAGQVAGAGLALLATLADKSFLSPTPGGRYGLHPLLCQYGAEQLQAIPDEWTAARDRHCRYFTALLAEQEDRLKGGEQPAAIADINAEIENVRAAWRWAVERGHWDEVARSLDSLFLFYDTLSWFEEGEAAFRAAAGAARGGAAPGLLGRLLARQGVFSFRLYQFEMARALLLESRAGGQAADGAEAAFTLNWLGATVIELGDYEQAQKAHEDSLAFYRAAGDTWGTAIALSNLGTVLQRRGRFADARRLYHEGLALKETIGDRRGIVFTLGDLAFQAILLGDYGEARRLAEQGLTIAREIGDMFLTMPPIGLLAQVAHDTGDYGEARRLADDSAGGLAKLAGPVGLAHVFTIRGLLAAAQGEYAEANGLFEMGLVVLQEEKATEMRGYVLNHQGGALILAGDAEGAEHAYRAGLDIYRQLGHPLGTATALAGLGRAALLRGGPGEAGELGLESLALARQAGSHRQVAESLALLGRAAAARGDDAAARLHLREALGIAAQIGARPLALGILVELAALEARQGRPDQAAGLLALVAAHPAAAHAARERAARLAALPPAPLTDPPDVALARALDAYGQEL